MKSLKTICTLLFLFALFGQSQAQEEVRFTASVSLDSILLGNYFILTFELENAQSNQFDAPSFEDFNVIAGPNMSSSMLIENGVMRQRISYSYYLEPKDIGNFYIQPAFITVDDQVYETLPLEVMVVPNPDGIKQVPEGQQPRDRGFWLDDSVFPELELRMPIPKREEPKKKKRKTTRL